MSVRRVSITLRDLRVAKYDGSKMRVQPCSSESEDFLNALAQYGEENVPPKIGKALTDCMEIAAQKVQPASIRFHLAKFVKRRK